jgi:hypothetical protein
LSKSLILETLESISSNFGERRKGMAQSCQKMAASQFAQKFFSPISSTIFEAADFCHKKPPVEFK